MIEELDEEFGVGDLVQEEFRNDTSLAYSSRNLRGLKVEHSLVRRLMVMCRVSD